MPRQLKQSSKLVMTYTFLFFILAICLFAPYYFTNTSLIWQSDGIAQHYPALVQWQSDLKNIIFNHKFPINWSWQLGLGNDYYQTFSYYTLGDIFTYGTAFISEKHLLTYYNVMIIIRLYLAGLACLMFIQHWFKSSPTWQYQVAALTYVFSGYTAFSAFEHPFFINPLIIFPLLIWSMHYALTKNKYSPLILMAFWTIWNNFYFAFMLIIGLIVFWIGYHYQHKTWLAWQSHLKILVAGIIALMLAAPLFFPSVDAVLNSARTNSGLANGLTIYPLYYYLALPGNLIANLTTPSFWLTGGFSAISVMAIIFSLRRWHRYQLFNILWIITFLGCCTPLFAAILNGGSSPSNRWLFMLSLPISVMLFQMLEHLSELTLHDYLSFFIIGIVATISLLITSNFNLNMQFGMIIAIYFVTLIMLWFSQSVSGFRPVWLVILVLINIFFITARNHTNNTNPAKTDLLSNDTVKQLLAQQKEYPKNKPGSFTRSYVDNQLNNMTGIAPATNLPINGPLNNIESYWSLQNGAVGEGLASLNISTANPNDITGNLDSRNVLSNLLGVADRFENPGTLTPNSYIADNNKTINGQTITHSDNAYPLLYLTNNNINRQFYNKLTATQKEAVLADSIVTRTGKQHTSTFANSVVTGNIRTDLTKNPTQTIHMTYTTHPELLPAGFYLSPSKALKGTELHLEISNIQFKPFTFKQQQKAALANYQYMHKQNKQNPQTLIDRQYNKQAYTWNWYKKHISSIGNGISGYTLTATYNDFTNSFKQTGQANLSFYNPLKEVTLNLGQAAKTSQETFIPLTFSKAGRYSFDVQIKGIPTDKRFDKVAREVINRSPAYKLTGNQIKTRLHVNKAQILATTIPYSHGWKINGNHKIIKLDSGFIGVPLKVGQNNIKLTYRTPGLTFAKYICLFGFIILLIVLVCQLRKHPKFIN